MSGLLRIVVFVAALAAAFGGAAAIGRAVGPLERGTERDPHAEKRDAMPAHESEAASGAVGLATAANGFRFAPARTELRTGSAPFRFRILGARSFDVVDARRMHLIVVRRDLQYYQHVHPVRRADGSWRTALRFAKPGVYRAFADFSAGGRQTVLGIDVLVTGRVHRARVEVQGPRPTMAREPGALTFDVGVLAEPYLGARGHLVVLRKRDLAYIHTHPHGDTLHFEVDLPTPGRYRAFLQYRIRGLGVRTAAFDLEER